MSVSTTLPPSFAIPTVSSTLNMPNPIVASNEQDSAFNNLSRFLPIVNIPSTLVRYNLFINNNIAVDVSYSDSDNPKILGHSIFQSILACSGKNIGYDNETLLFSGLYIGDRTNDDRDRVKEIIADCIDNSTISILNDTDNTLLIKDARLSTSSKIIFKVVADIKSQILMLLGWYIVWFGFVILLREGPFKMFKR